MQPDNTAFVLKHRCSTRRQGIIELLQVVLFLALLLVVYQAFFAHWVWQRGNDFAWFIAVVGVLTFCIALHAGWQIVLNREFVCRTDGRMIECLPPDRYSGATFRLAIADIAKIEKDSKSESVWWYLHDMHGNRHWLSSNYGNPVRQFVEIIRQANPSVLVIGD